MVGSMSYVLLLALLATVPSPAPRGAAGTAILEWKNPSRDLELRYGVGEAPLGTAGPVYRARAAQPGTSPLTVQLSLPVGEGSLWYGFADLKRPDDVYAYTITKFRCPPRGALRIELNVAKERYPPPNQDSEYVTVDELYWQEGCTFPDRLAFTAPAVARANARWLDPRAGAQVFVRSDRGAGMWMEKGRDARVDVLMQSGPGTVWVELTAAGREIWAMHVYRYTCEDGGRLDLTVRAGIMKDRPNMAVELGGTGCRSLGLVQPPCGSGKRRRGRTRDVMSGCQVPLPDPVCCVEAPNMPGDE